MIPRDKYRPHHDLAMPPQVPAPAGSTAQHASDLRGCRPRGLHHHGTVWLTWVLILATGLPASLAASAATTGPEAYLGTWHSENGKATFALEADGRGSYRVLVASLDAGSPTPFGAAAGDTLVTGLRWDQGKRSFVDGTATVERDGKPVTLDCVLKPRDGSSLEFRLSMGLLGKSAIWWREGKR